MMIKNVLSNVISGVISGVIVGPDLPPGPFPAIQALYYKEPIGGSEATMRYQWNMDGQSMFWSRGADDFGFVSTAKLAASYIPLGTAGFQMIVGRTSSDRFYIGVTADVLTIGSGSLTIASVTVDVGEENYTEIEYTGTNLIATHNNVEVYNAVTDFSGVLDNVGFGATSAMDSFFHGAINAFLVEADANSYPYKTTGNGATAKPIGSESPSTADLTRQNGEPDGSDIKLIERQSDNSGWVGENVWTYGGWSDDGSSPAFGNQIGTSAGGVVNGTYYRVRATNNLTHGSCQFRLGENAQVFITTVSGDIDVVLYSDKPSERLFIQNTVMPTVGSVTNIIVEPIYDYAAGAND